MNWTTTGTQCATCQKTAEEARLHPCPNCSKRVCGEHSYRRSGKHFCGRQCAEFFFYAEPDETDD